ncbi:hypothetical protein RHGRI_036325 [Rhododendron griersonianum]|uniref:GRAS family transcription factor n=1 Tax=Rhododendron griersonianum TaxID=479676 RepID=A0AAV6HRM4_9ERIC|nr:hypothetical protein RHGRI_036325 [Rhododendron griersonianum]
MGELEQLFSAPFLYQNRLEYSVDLPSLSSEGYTEHVSPASSSGVSSEDSNASKQGDFCNGTLRLIDQMLMEEDDLENKPGMFQQGLALQTTEKSFYDALGKEYPDSTFSNDQEIQNPLQFNFDGSSKSFGFVRGFVGQSLLQSIMPPKGGSGDGLVDYHFSPSHVIELPSYGSTGEEDENKQEKSPNRSIEKKTHDREDGGDFGDGGRGKRHMASFAEESNYHFEIYDKVLLCPRLNPHLHEHSSQFLVHDHVASPTGAGKKLRKKQKRPLIGSSEGERERGKKDGNKKEVVDLTTLLSECARAISRADISSVNNLLNGIRQHSSPYGDGIERMAHYFANALEARLARIGQTLYAGFTTSWISAADIIRGYEVYVKACPFNWLSNMYANRSIGTLVQDTQRLHIIDFGILYGFQWPCLIQRFSMRPGRPPRLRITGIDFPQPGLRPAERVEETGRRIAMYCKRFGVPFEFNAIAQKWDTINLEDLKIESDEVLVVNCLHRLKNVPVETVKVNCPRDAVLNLVKRVNPDIFIHGVQNGYYNAPFFLTRFREAIFYFSSLFDMFDTVVPREDEGRRMYEGEVWGRGIMNVIACEGTERVERPESYQQWQVRNVRAGFRQLPVNQEIMRELRAIVKQHYNKNFVVDEDGKWMVQGWKGRIMFALSCWKPANN